MFSNWFNVGVQCTSYRSVLMCGIGMYSRLIRGWVQCTRYMSGLMCDIVFQLLIRDGGTVYSEYFWVDVWYRYSAIDLRGVSVPGTGVSWHVVSMLWNGDKRLIHNSVQCIRYMSGLTCGEYGIEWWPVIDSQFGTVYPVTCPVRHVVIMVWNGIKRLIRGGVQSTRYSSTLTSGEYGM